MRLANHAFLALPAALLLVAACGGKSEVTTSSNVNTSGSSGASGSSAGKAGAAGTAGSAAGAGGSAGKAGSSAGAAGTAGSAAGAAGSSAGAAGTSAGAAGTSAGAAGTSAGAAGTSAGAAGTSAGAAGTSAGAAGTSAGAAGTSAGAAGAAGSSAGAAGAAGSPDAPNKMFITSSKVVPGDLGGLDGADALCMKHAMDAGLTGTFKAWLSTSTTSAVSRLAGSRGWVRVDGQPFADRPEDLAAGAVYFPPRLDEKGKDLGANVLAVTATGADGLVSGPTCGDWKDPLANPPIVAGDASGTTRRWTTANQTDCGTNAARLYCFETGHVVETKPAAVKSLFRRAFVTDQPFAVAGGLAAADKACNDEAAAASVPGTFVAYLATKDASAASRLDLTGIVYRRLDFAMLTPTIADLADPKALLDTALNLTPKGTYLGDDVYAWSGVPADAQMPGMTGLVCDDWTTAATPTFAGQLARTDKEWFMGGTTTTCGDTSTRLYCFEK